MHFHHRHDVDGCLDVHIEYPEPLRAVLATLDRLESRMSTQQQQIDGLVADVKAVTEALAAKAVDTVDLSGLTAAVADLKTAAGVDAPAPAPAPAEQPAAPAEPPVAPPASNGPVVPVDAAPGGTVTGPIDITVPAAS